MVQYSYVTLSLAPGASPMNVTVTNQSPELVSMLWLPPPSDTHNGDIIGYVIEFVYLILKFGRTQTYKFMMT